jgi:hypothetical protein
MEILVGEKARVNLEDETCGIARKVIRIVLISLELSTEEGVDEVFLPQRV